MGKLVLLGKHITVQPYMGDMRFDRCTLLAKISREALDWPSFPREWRTSDFLLLARLRQTNVASGWRYARVLYSAFVYPRATAAQPAAKATSSTRSRQQQKALLAKPRRLTWPTLAWPNVDA